MDAPSRNSMPGHSGLSCGGERPHPFTGRREAHRGMSPKDKKFSPSDPIGTTDAPDSEVAGGARVSADIITARKAICVYAGQNYSVGAKV